MPKDSENPGYYVTSPPKNAAESAFFLVLGAPRGGTTLLIHSLARMGIFVGEKIPFTGEDPHYARYISAGNEDAWHELIKTRSEAHKRHAWKFPQLIHETKFLSRLPASTRLILVFRDPVATGIRGFKATNQPFLVEAETSLDYQMRLLRFAKSFSGPILFVSYEKVLMNPHTLSDALRAFTGITDQVKLDRVREGVKPSPSFYLNRDSEWKRKELSRGLQACLDRLTSREVCGWAFFPGAPDKPVNLEIELESGAVFHTLANQRRNDLKEGGIHPTGQCGFRFPFPSSELLAPGDLVHLREVDSQVEFEGGPFLFNATHP